MKTKGPSEFGGAFWFVFLRCFGLESHGVMCTFAIH